jgi:hypothetical protein
MKVVEVLPTVGNPAVLELKDKAAIDIQSFAVSHATVVVDADHATFIIRKHVAEFGLEGASSLPAVATELRKDLLAAHPIAGDGTSSRRMPGGILVEELREGLHVGGVEGLVTAADNLSVLVHGVP